MARTISGHQLLVAGSPDLKTLVVPGVPGNIKLTAHRDAVPLFCDVAKLANSIYPVLKADTWSYAVRPPRLTGRGYSDHGGWAVDIWSSRIGTMIPAFRCTMTPEQAHAFSLVLEKYRTPDGAHVFGWGVYAGLGGVVYTGPTYHQPSSNDPCHVHVAAGVTVADLQWCRKRLGIAADGSWKKAA